MPPKLVSDDGRHVVIRPLAYVRERDLARYAEAEAFPIIPCNLCGSQEHLQRRQVGAMLRDWEKKHPGRIESIYNALAKVVPSHLMDRALFDFAAVRATGRAEPDGDLAFDVDPALERAIDAAAAAAIGDRSRLRRGARRAGASSTRHRDSSRRQRCAGLRTRIAAPPRSLRVRAVALAALLALVASVRAQRAAATSARRRSPGGAPRSAAHGGYILYFRHTSTDFGQNDEQMTGYEDCARAAQPHRRGPRRGARDRRRDSRARHPGRRRAREPVLPHAGDRQLIFGRASVTPAVRGGPARADDGALRRAAKRCSHAGAPAASISRS